VANRRSLGFVGVAIAATVALSACGGGGGRGGSPETSAPATGSNGTTSGTTKFGTIDSPCGKGNAKGATDRGVTDTNIQIGYGDDRGFAQSPGLNKEMGDGVKAFIKWCNDQGGINGRQITGDFYDAKISLANNVMTTACTKDFMMVGEGFAADGSAEATRVKCNMVAVPGFSVLADFANGPMMYQAVPNPVDFTPASSYYQVVKLFPAEAKKFAFVDTTLEATHVSILKDKGAMQQAGIQFAGCDITINYFGESDYKPFIRKLQDCGAKMIFTNVVPGPVLFNFITAMHQLNYNPIFLMEAASYTTPFAQWNTAGYANNTYVREAFLPLEAADVVPAIKQYLDIVKGDGGGVSQLGEQAVSSFLLWATAAKSCGSNLTRQCIVNYLANVHDWTGGGLHAAGDVGKNMPPQCGVLLKLTNTTWSQFYPKKAGALDCDPKYIATVPQNLWGTKLNADRIATTFLTPNVISPKS
jgi:ABC-type branched-subunit amino acid transport system substrate-binding protein